MMFVFSVIALIGVIAIAFRTMLGIGEPGELGVFLFRLVIVLMCWQLLVTLLAELWNRII